MYMADLSPYQYDLQWPLPNVLAVGWLEKGQSFPTGSVSHQLIHNLDLLIRTSEINKMRGYHHCDFCTDPELNHFLRARLDSSNAQNSIPCDERPHVLGHAEVWVPAKEGSRIFAAPTLIYHYITEHSYQPPESFVSAVESFDFESNWQAHKVLEDLITDHYRSMK